MSDQPATGGYTPPFNKEYDPMMDETPEVQPKPATGEWTVQHDNMIYCGQEFIAVIVDLVQRGRIVDAHNAALAAERKKVKELEAWKDSALAVMPDYQAIGKALGLALGESVHDKILPAIKQLAAEREKREVDWQLVVGALDSLGVALADHDHQWTEGERAIYEKAIEIIRYERV